MIENKTTEFKHEYMDDIKYAVVAFANTNGGKIYRGICSPRGILRSGF